MDWFNYVYGVVVMSMFVVITICVLVVTLNVVFRDPLKRETEAYNRGYVDGFNSQRQKENTMFNSAEEYVLPRLDTLEKERDERLKTVEGDLAKEKVSNEDRSVVFTIAPVKAVEYDTTSAYYYKREGYGFGNIEALKAALALDDTALYEWATREYGEGWNKIKPIERFEKEFNYQLHVFRDGKVERYASIKNDPGGFRRIYDVEVLGNWFDPKFDSAAKANAIKDTRNAIRSAIEDLEEEAKKEGNR